MKFKIPLLVPNDYFFFFAFSQFFVLVEDLGNFSVAPGKVFLRCLLAYFLIDGTSHACLKSNFVQDESELCESKELWAPDVAFGSTSPSLWSFGSCWHC